MKPSDSTRSADSGRHEDSELDLMDRVASPRFNPWLALILLMLGGFLYIWIWGALLRG
ncbi:MAG: hypothetical protein OXL36_14645 [Bryobacterales bacterium]|nr:hypothetical protein [Bryobacterales bacterium]MDE0293824.1 hypothetical protein [Bryobacterales bacterium]